MEEIKLGLMIEIRSFEEINPVQWDELCLNSATAWFQHTTHWIKYISSMRFEKDSINHSFGIFENKKLIAIIPLIEESIYATDKREISMAGFPTPFPAFSDNAGESLLKKLQKKIFEKIFNINDVDYMSFYVHPLTDTILNKEILVNPLPAFGFHDTTISTNILRLDRSKEELFRNIRKGHKCDINTAVKNGDKVEILDSYNFDEEKFNVYRNIHFNAAGRKTRPDETWECMENWIKDGYSILGLLKENDVYIAGAFINTYKHKAYYQSGATLPAYEGEKGIGHLLQWEIIKYLKMNGSTHYEIGWNWYANISQEVADEKMLGISRFKAGFGADKYPLFRGEYFANKDYFKNVYKQKIENYLSLNLFKLAQEANE